MLNRTINIKGELFSLDRPVVMGILNVTPDSFFAGSRKRTETEITTRIEEILAEKSRWLMRFPLDRCGIAPAIAAILAPTSLALFPWNVPIVLNIQFSRSRKYFLLYTPNMKFSALTLRKILASSMNQRLCSRRCSRLRSFWREKSRILSFLARSMVL